MWTLEPYIRISSSGSFWRMESYLAPEDGAVQYANPDVDITFGGITVPIIFPSAFPEHYYWFENGNKATWLSDKYYGSDVWGPVFRSSCSYTIGWKVQEGASVSFTANAKAFWCLWTGFRIPDEHQWGRTCSVSFIA